MLIAFILFMCLVIYGLYEYSHHRKNIERIPLRILVNGTRGKTTGTRLIAYSLIKKGIKTVARTSGSSLEIIHSDGCIEKIERKRRAGVDIRVHGKRYPCNRFIVHQENLSDELNRL